MTTHNCPTCESPNPKKHPAVQFEGEVNICEDLFHEKEARPEPEWLTHVRFNMVAEIGALRLGSEPKVIAEIATGVAASHLRPLYRVIADLETDVTERDEVAAVLNGRIEDKKAEIRELRAQLEARDTDESEYKTGRWVTDGNVAAYRRAASEVLERFGIDRDAVVNEAIRAGLSAIQWPSREARPSPEEADFVTLSRDEIRERLLDGLDRADKDFVVNMAHAQREVVASYLTDWLMPGVASSDVQYEVHPDMESIDDFDPPNHGEDKPDYEALYTAMREALHAQQGFTPEVAVRAACQVAMNEIEPRARLLRQLSKPSPEMREVPPTEMRQGDRYTITGEVGIYRASPVGPMQPGDVHLTGWDSEEVYLYATTVTVTRPVSPLPEKPGTLVTVEIEHEGIKEVRNGVVVEQRRVSFAPRIGRYYRAGLPGDHDLPVITRVIAEYGEEGN